VLLARASRGLWLPARPGLEAHARANHFEDEMRVDRVRNDQDGYGSVTYLRKVGLAFESEEARCGSGLVEELSSYDD